MPEPALWDSLAPFAQYLINGLTFGALIALIALGYTMVYGIVELINFAHGDLFMLGCFLLLTVVDILLPAKDPSSIAIVLALGFGLIVTVLFPTATVRSERLNWT